MDKFSEIQKAISSKFTWEIFERVLINHSQCETVQLIMVEQGKPTKKGDSYLSTLTRFSVKYLGERGSVKNIYHLHVIAKSLLKNIGQRNTFRNSDFFTNEIVFYSEVWPELNNFQQEIKTDKLFKEIPNYLCGDYDGSNDYILLEDLTFQGYVCVNRTNTLTFDRALLVLSVLAHFHGLGFACSIKKPNLFMHTANKLKETYFHNNLRTWYVKFHNNLKDVTLDAVQQELPEEYSKKLKERFSGDIYGDAIEQLALTASSKYKAITHGDTWMPNFLIQFNNQNQPIHSVMIDFQLARLASIATDLHFFIYACTDADLRAERYNDLLMYYIEIFNSIVTMLCPDFKDVLTYTGLMEELRGSGKFALCMAMEAGIMSMLDDDEVSDLDQIQGNDALPLETVWIVKNLKSKQKRVKLASVIKHMMDNNFI